MTTNNSYSVPAQYPHMESAQSLGGHGLDHELWTNGQIPGIDSAGSYPVMNYDNGLPPTRYIGSMEYDYPLAPHLATDPAEQQGSQSQRQPGGHGTPWITQYSPIPPGPPRREQYAPDVANDRPPSHVPLSHNIAGPSRGIPGLGHAGMSVAEDLKDRASHYLHNPCSQVDKLHVMRSRSGAVKVLILLEIDDTM